MFIIGIILLIFALCFISCFNDSIKRDWLRYDENKKYYCELRDQGIKTKSPKLPKINHASFELSFVILIISAILFMAYPEKSNEVISKIPHLFVWFYFGHH